MLPIITIYISPILVASSFICCSAFAHYLIATEDQLYRVMGGILGNRYHMMCILSRLTNNHIHAWVLYKFLRCY